MTLIVVEGVDGSGKSTLIADLAHELPDGVHIIRRGPIKSHPMEEYELPLIEYATHSREHYLLDRWHIGELIYGPLYRGQSQLTPAMRMHVDMVLDRLGALKILMDTPLDLVRQRLERRGEDFLQMQHLQLVHDAYREHCTWADGWVSLTSTAKLKPSVLIESAMKLEDNANVLEYMQSYVGPVKPDVLLLGDMRNPPVHGRPRYPWAFVPYRDTSGHFLLTALDAVGMTNVGIANAREEDIPELWSLLGEPKICVLGSEAYKATFTYPIEVKSAIRNVVQHPQYVRRFKNKSMVEYGQQIKETARG